MALDYRLRCVYDTFICTQLTDRFSRCCCESFTGVAVERISTKSLWWLDFDQLTTLFRAEGYAVVRGLISVSLTDFWKHGSKEIVLESSGRIYFLMVKHWRLIEEGFSACMTEISFKWGSVCCQLVLWQSMYKVVVGFWYIGLMFCVTE